MEITGAKTKDAAVNRTAGWRQTVIHSLMKLAAGIACVAALATAAPAKAGTIEIDNALGCDSFMFGFCFSPAQGKGNFTIHNNTTEWSVTGFVVTTDPVTVVPPPAPFTESHPSSAASASTTRPDWLASTGYVGVNPIVSTLPPLFCPPIPIPGFTCEPTIFTTPGAYEAQFIYTSGDNDILPGESNGDFFWQHASTFGFPGGGLFDSSGLNLATSYVIYLAGLDDDSTAVCTGTLAAPGIPLIGTGPSTSTCDAPSSTLVADSPEPGALALLAGGLVGLGLSRRRKCPVA